MEDIASLQTHYFSVKRSTNLRLENYFSITNIISQSKFMRTVFYLLGTIIMLSSCQQKSDVVVAEASLKSTSMTTTTNRPALIHTVYFWAKEGTSVTDITAFEDGLRKLGTCPQILDFYWGKPASTEKRDVVDNSFTYAINIHFASAELQAEYQKEPIHLAFIEDHKDIWGKVVVYDNQVD